MRNFILVISALVILQGCSGKGTTMVLNSPSERHIASSYYLKDAGSTVGVDSNAKKLFESEIRKGLSNANMGQGHDLEIDYRFVQFDEGSRFIRYMAGGFGNAGEGEMTVQVTFKNKDGKEIAQIHVGGKINAGLFGGSFDGAIEQAARQVVNYVQANFKA